MPTGAMPQGSRRHQVRQQARARSRDDHPCAGRRCPGLMVAGDEV
jgi:hypothetical protein